ncbi:MAG: thiamine phosphate synthase [Oscillospiraceae bacterium]|nr:thiamine phosphate synthase [Oscillospiraceae bacterium]
MDIRNIRLYGITSGTAGCPLSLEEAVRAAVRGGVGMLQLREKSISEDDYVGKAKSLLKVTKELGIPLIINDSVDAALKSGADGVHLGQSDGRPERAREILGENAIIGVTAKTVEQALSAERAGADYFGCGAVFGSRTKENAVPMSMETLREICAAVSIPVFAIGGINAENAGLLKGSGICGIAVVSAIFGKSSLEETEAEARTLYEISRDIVRE